MIVNNGPVARRESYELEVRVQAPAGPSHLILY